MGRARLESGCSPGESYIGVCAVSESSRSKQEAYAYSHRYLDSEVAAKWPCQESRSAVKNDSNCRNSTSVSG